MAHYKNTIDGRDLDNDLVISTSRVVVDTIQKKLQSMSSETFDEDRVKLVHKAREYFTRELNLDTLYRGVFTTVLDTKGTVRISVVDDNDEIIVEEISDFAN